MMKQHRVLDYRKPETSASHLAGTSLVNAVKPLKKMRNMLGRHSWAIVREAEGIEIRAFRQDLHGDCNPFAPVCDGIVSQVSEY